MTDIVSPETRSRMMSGIRGKDTKPEITIRKALFARGFRYRLHDKKLPGKPDLSFPRYRSVILVHGCFWHQHNCRLFKWPKSNQEFWRNKIQSNSERDKKHRLDLTNKNWRILTIWECSLKGKSKDEKVNLIDSIEEWLLTGQNNKEIPQGTKHDS